MPAPTPTVWTVQSLLAWTTEYLKSKNIEAARREAELLLAHVLRTSRTDLLMRYDEAPADTDRARFRELITKRVASWPVAYLIGSRGFYLLDFDVGPAVLIPRPRGWHMLEKHVTVDGKPVSASLFDFARERGCEGLGDIGIAELRGWLAAQRAAGRSPAKPARASHSSQSMNRPGTSNDR